MRKIALMASAIVMIMAFSAMAETKIAIVDYGRAMFDSAAGKKATEDLKKLDADKSAAVKPLAEELQKMESDFAAKEKLLTEDAKRQEVAKFQAKYAEYEKQVRQAQAEIQQKSDELTKKTKDQLDLIIAEYAREKKYDLVMQIQGVVFHQNLPDITDDVIARYNKAFTGK